MPLAMLAPRCVARLDDAVALLLVDVPAKPEAHLAAAEMALRQHYADATIHAIRRESGRPALAPPHRHLGLSLAARGGILAVGYCGTHDVGVDLEKVDAQVDCCRLASDHFQPTEAEWIRALPPAEVTAQFFRMWCIKEAVLKATGRGVYDGMTEPDLSRLARPIVDGGILALPAGMRTPKAQATTAEVVMPDAAFVLALAVLWE